MRESFPCRIKNKEAVVGLKHWSIGRARNASLVGCCAGCVSPKVNCGMQLIHMNSEYLFAYGLVMETCQFSMSFSWEPRGEGTETHPCPGTDRVQFSTAWTCRESGLDWF